MNAPLGCLLLALVALTLLLHLNSTSARRETVTQDAGAWSAPTPTIGEAWTSAPTYDYELGYADGWTDHANGENFGGDR